jgi:hypothetical protein
LSLPPKLFNPLLNHVIPFNTFMQLFVVFVIIVVIIGLKQGRAGHGKLKIF